MGKRTKKESKTVYQALLEMDAADMAMLLATSLARAEELNRALQREDVLKLGISQLALCPELCPAISGEEIFGYPQYCEALSPTGTVCRECRLRFLRTEWPEESRKGRTPF